MIGTQFFKGKVPGEDGDQYQVRFGAGMTYSQLIKAVDAEGLAIQNLPSLPHINIVGSMLTGTHGSGHKYKILTSRVTEFDIVLPDGTLKTLSSASTPHFWNYLFNFGGLGVVTSMTMMLVPKFMVHKAIYEDLQWDTLFNKKTFDTVMHRQDFLSFFTDWKERKMNSVWVGKKYMPNEIPPDYEPEYFGAKHITTPNVHPCPGQDPSACVVTGNGTWREKIYHFLPDKPPSSAGNEIQTEFFVRFEDFTSAMEELYKIRDHFLHLVQVTEVRMCKGDDIPMSPAKGSGDYIGIHFTWHRKFQQILNALPKIEKTLQKFNVKPHLGKLFKLSGERFETLYGKDL